MGQILHNTTKGYQLWIDPTDHYKEWTKDQLLQTLGYCGQWAVEYTQLHDKNSDVSLKDFMLDCYGMHSGAFDGQCNDFMFISPHDEDNDLPAYVAFQYGDQNFTMYPYSITHFGKEDYITRMD